MVVRSARQRSRACGWACMSGSVAALDLRRYRVSDAAPTRSVFERAVRQTAAGDYTQAQVEAWAPTGLTASEEDAWARARAAAETVVAIEDGEVAGFADLVDDALLDMLYVDPRFARRGIGSALIAHVLDLARSRGAAVIETDASVTARPVFEHHGFVVVAQQAPVVRGVAMTNYKMRLAIAPA